MTEQHYIVTGNHGWSAVPEQLALDPDVPAEAIRLYVVLRRYTSADTSTCWPGVDTLAERMGWSTAKVGRMLAALDDRGWIVRRRRIGTSSMTWVASYAGEPAPWSDVHGESVRSDLIGRSDQPVIGQSDHPVSDTSDHVVIGKREPVEREPVERHARPTTRTIPSVMTSRSEVIEWWPRLVRNQREAAKEWNRAIRRAGSSVEVLHGATTWVNAYGKPDGPDPEFCVGLSRWLREDGWLQPPPRPGRDEPAAPTTPVVDVYDFDEFGDPL